MKAILLHGCRKISCWPRQLLHGKDEGGIAFSLTSMITHRLKALHSICKFVLGQHDAGAAGSRRQNGWVFLRKLRLLQLHIVHLCQHIMSTFDISKLHQHISQTCSRSNAVSCLLTSRAILERAGSQAGMLYKLQIVLPCCRPCARRGRRSCMALGLLACSSA